MAKKLDYNYVKNYIESFGYELLTQEYKNAITKLDLICPKGTRYPISWNNFQQGHRCPCCNGKSIYDIEKAKKLFEERNAILLSTEYTNSRTKLDYICENGHKQSISLDSWIAGHGCKICAGNTKNDIEDIRQKMVSEDYILLTEVYINNKQKLDYICPNGHTHNISWSKWRDGKRCPYCAGQGKPDVEYIKSSMIKEGYTPLFDKYVNSKTKLPYICPRGHEDDMIWSSWRRGSRCNKCGIISAAEKQRKDFDEIKALFDNEKYKLLTEEYQNSQQLLEYECPLGHKHEMNWGNWRAGYRCPTCGVIKNSGETHYNWQGGISKEPYCVDWTKEFKGYIKDRDDHKCLNPYCNKKYNRLTVHHIDYNKKNCGPNNLITICVSCNSKANTNRKWHKAWYQAILKNRYGV